MSSPIGRLDFTAETAESAEREKGAKLNRWTAQITSAAMTVHRELGPGLLESAYEACLAFELANLGLQVVQQQPLPVVYRGSVASHANFSALSAVSAVNPTELLKTTTATFWDPILAERA